MAGYSSTPLVRKLGFKENARVLLLHAPAGYESWLGEVPAGLTFVKSMRGPVACAHLFASEAKVLGKELGALRRKLEPAGFVWVSWPKKASKTPTDITEDVIRDIALPLGFVDVKVCAVTDIWSGLKLVIRRTERQQPSFPFQRGSLL